MLKHRYSVAVDDISGPPADLNWPDAPFKVEHSSCQDILVGWVPFYWLTKCLFMIWCMAPMENNGSEIIYSR
jgi:hypothetical protein